MKRTQNQLLKSCLIFSSLVSSLHDAVIRRVRIREDFWNHYELTIDLDSHSAYAKIKRLVFHGSAYANMR